MSDSILSTMREILAMENLAMGIVSDSRLPTMREILAIEIDYRINVLKMSKRKTAVSLGYSESSFRHIYKRLKTDPECSIRLPNEGERKLESRAYAPRGIYKRKEE